jgi:hypothetical protein
MCETPNWLVRAQAPEREGVHRRDTVTVVYRSLRRFPYPKDIVVATEGDLALYGDAIGLVYPQALKEGKELYHAA